jgi:hypothetical protein
VRRQLCTEMPLNLLTGNFEHTTFFWIVFCVVNSLGPNLSSHTHFYLKLPEKRKKGGEQTTVHFMLVFQCNIKKEKEG